MKTQQGISSVKTVTHYYPFGMPIPDRIWGAPDKYRFGFNGMEMDNDVDGLGNFNTTEFREVDSRLGRWWSIDPVVKPWESPYAGFGNNPIYFADPSGLDPSGGTDRLKFGQRFKNWVNGDGYKNKANKAAVDNDGIATDYGSRGIEVEYNFRTEKVGEQDGRPVYAKNSDIQIFKKDGGISFNISMDWNLFGHEHDSYVNGGYWMLTKNKDYGMYGLYNHATQRIYGWFYVDDIIATAKMLSGGTSSPSNLATGGLPKTSSFPEIAEGAVFGIKFFDNIVDLLEKTPRDGEVYKNVQTQTGSVHNIKSHPMVNWNDNMWHHDQKDTLYRWTFPSDTNKAYQFDSHGVHTIDLPKK